MEVQNSNISSNNKWQQLYLQLNASFNQYIQNRTKIQCWNKLFWRLNTWLGKDGPLSADSQKLINFYLQHKSQSSLMGNLIFQYKEIICKIYDLGMINAQSLDQGISSGGLADALYKKFQKDDGFSIGSFKVLLFCAQAVAIHICEFLKKFKQANGSHILPINRKLCKMIRRKNLTYTSSAQFMKQCFTQPVFVLDSFMDNIKPILTNYLNMESLFEVTSLHFKHKKAFLTGSIQPGTQFIGKIINLNAIFDSTYTGRQMIENKLKQLTLGDIIQYNSNQIWSLTSCITQLQPALYSIIQKLPMFLRPKCNGDILSFCRNEMFPTFKYQVLNSGYVEKPILSQYFTVFMNVGKNYFDLLCFPETGNIESQLTKYQKQNIYAIIDRLNVKYSKVRIGPKSLAVVPNNNYFILSAELNKKDQKTLTQIIYWNILPKDPQSIKKSINIIQKKKKRHKNYYFIPTQQLFLDYLSHEYLKLNDLPTLQFVKQYINTQINKQEQKVISIIKTQPNIQIKNKLINCQNRFCGFCKINFVNYFGKTNQDYICMECTYNLRDKVQQIYYLHNPHDIRYPLTLVKIYVDTRKHPGESIENKYEKNVCCGQFIGSIDTEYCKGEHITQSQQSKNQNIPLNNYKNDQLFFMNRSKELKIVSAQQMLASIAILQPSLSQRPALLQKIRVLTKQVEDGQNFIKSIGSKYEDSNLVTDIIWAYRAKKNPQCIFN